MAAFAARRPTRDIDLAATGFANEIAEVEQRVRAIFEHDRDDGLKFDGASVVGEPIRDEADYSGVRVKVVARLAAGRVALHVDVNFGDPIWSAPARAVPPLLLGGTLTLRGYPDHMVLAEKIVTDIDRGELNTRWRDFVDIAALAAARRIRYDDLRAASRPSRPTDKFCFSRSPRSWSPCRTLHNVNGQRGGESSASARQRPNASVISSARFSRSPILSSIAAPTATRGMPRPNRGVLRTSAPESRRCRGAGRPA